MIIYIKFQAAADDAKEVSAAILALLFACVQSTNGYVDDSDRDDIAEEAVKTGKYFHEPRDLFAIVDRLTINDLVVDNRLSEGEIRYVLQLRNNVRNTTWR